MKFSNFLFFASFALAAPTLEVRTEQTVVGTIFESIKTLEAATKTNAEEISEYILDILPERPGD